MSFSTRIIVAYIVVSIISAGSGLNLPPLPTPSKAYQAADAEYDDAGLSPLFNFARSFINTALPTFPKDLVADVIDNKVTLNIDFAKDLVLKRFLGYATAVVVGILFMVLFPLVGCCFCCCRMCGKCGGSRTQQEEDGTHCWRRVLTCVVFVVVVFTATGNICTYVTNGRMTLAVNTLEDTVINNFDDIDTFLDTLSAQVHEVAGNNLNATEQDILGHIGGSNLADEISKTILANLSNGAFDKMQNHIDDLGAAFKDVSEKKAAVDLAFGSGGTSPLAGMDISTLQTQVNSFITGSPIKEAKSKLVTEINSALSGTQIADIKTSVTDAFTSMRGDISDIITMVDDIKTKAKDNGFDIDDYKKKVKDYSDMAKTYDHYRFLAGAGLAGVTSLIVVLQTCGLVFGFFGQGASTKPSERGCVSNSGGNCLIASVAFIFLFSSLLMLLTTLSFAVGSMLERFVCQPLTDLSFLELVEDKMPCLPKSPADILSNCKDGQAAYKAFGLNQKFPLSKLDTTLASAKTNIKGNMDTKLQTLTSSVSASFDFTQIQAPLTALSTNLQAVDNMITAVDVLLSSAIGPLPRSSLTAFKASLVKLQDLRKNMEGTSPPGVTWYSEFTTGLTDVKTSVTSGTKLKDIVDQYVNGIISIAEEYVDYVKKTLSNDLGRCDPVWNLYNSVVLIAFCKYTIDAFNGFWFSVGWCVFFFMPGVIFSVKLAKYFRTMSDGDGDERSSELPSLRNNKVAPSQY